jgi:hypothetical protein
MVITLSQASLCVHVRVRVRVRVCVCVCVCVLERRGVISAGRDNLILF